MTMSADKQHPRESEEQVREPRTPYAATVETAIEREDKTTSLEMNRVLATIPAHFDGAHIQLDVEVELKPRTRLLVVILDQDMSNEALVWSAMKASEAAFARVWDNEEDAVYDHL